MASPALAVDAAVKPREERRASASFWSDAWWRLRHDPTTMAALGVLIIMVLLAVSADLLADNFFNWPGLGRLFFDSLIQKDYPIIQASLVMGSGLLLISYIMRDITYALIDPRIKVR